MDAIAQKGTVMRIRTLWFTFVMLLMISMVPALHHVAG
jgi:hypothetical protein